MTTNSDPTQPDCCPDCGPSRGGRGGSRSRQSKDFAGKVGGVVVVRDSRGLTARQAAILQFIEQSVRERGYPPTLREIGAHMKIKSTNGVNDHLVAIERKGYLRREPTAARGLSIVTPGQTELERRREQLRAELAAVEAQLGGVSHAA